jgi:hypothetical protein
MSFVLQEISKDECFLRIDIGNCSAAMEIAQIFVQPEKTASLSFFDGCSNRSLIGVNKDTVDSGEYVIAVGQYEKFYRLVRNSGEDAGSGDEDEGKITWRSFFANLGLADCDVRVDFSAHDETLAMEKGLNECRGFQLIVG